MAKTPGYITPSMFSSKDAAVADLRRRSEAAGYTPFDLSEFFSEEALEHFGTKGMKWGQRKKRADEQDRKKTFGPAAINARAERAQKIRRGAIVVAGAIAIGLVLSKRGRTVVTDMAVTNYAQQRSARSQAAANPISDLARRFRDVKAASVPSPNQMLADSRMAAVRNTFNRSGAQRLTDSAWRDQARLTQLSREMDATTNGLLNGNIAALTSARRGG